MLRAAACFATIVHGLLISLLRGLLLLGIGIWLAPCPADRTPPRCRTETCEHPASPRSASEPHRAKRSSAVGCSCSPSQCSTPTACRCAALEALIPQVSRSSSIMSWRFNSPACAAAMPRNPATMTSAIWPSAAADQPRQDAFEISGSLINFDQSCKFTNLANLPIRESSCAAVQGPDLGVFDPSSPKLLPLDPCRSI